MSQLLIAERPSTRSTAMATQRAPGRRNATTTAPCPHHPQCPAADAVNHSAAHVVASYPEQGWSLLCNGVISFEDTGELLPDGSAIGPHRGAAPHRAMATAGA